MSDRGQCKAIGEAIAFAYEHGWPLESVRAADAEVLALLGAAAAGELGSPPGVGSEG